MHLRTRYGNRFHTFLEDGLDPKMCGTSNESNQAEEALAGPFVPLRRPIRDALTAGPMMPRTKEIARHP